MTDNPYNTEETKKPEIQAQQVIQSREWSPMTYQQVPNSSLSNIDRYQNQNGGLFPLAIQQEGTKEPVGWSWLSPERPSYNQFVGHGLSNSFATLRPQGTSEDLKYLLTTPPSSFDAMESYPSPRKSFGSSRLVPEAAMGSAIPNVMSNYPREHTRSSAGFQAYQQCEFSNPLQTSPYHPSMVRSRDMAYYPLQNNELQHRSGHQIDAQNSEFPDRKFYEQRLGSSQLWIPGSKHGQNFVNEMGKLREAERSSFGRIGPDSNLFPHFPSTSGLGDILLENNDDDEMTELTGSMAMNELATKPSNRTSNQGPYQALQPIAPPVQTAENESCSKDCYHPMMVQSDHTGYINAQQSLSPQTNDIYNFRARQVEESLAAVIPENVQQVATAIQAEIDQLAQRREPGFLGQFRPSNSALKNVGLLDENQVHISPDTYGSSNNYRGDITIANNRSADIAEKDNCAIWILGLPPYAIHKDVMGSIRGVGQVYACVINPPTGQHYTSAAKIVFFERYQAENFMRFVNGGHFIVSGRQIRHVRWNKIKSARYPNSTNSRVIRLIGPRHLMNFGFFEVFFSQRFTYDLEARFEIPCDTPGMVTHEWRFGSLRCQAASAKTAIERELRGIFSVEWARDPCM